MNVRRIESPETLAEASALLRANPGARVLAGGTDLVPKLRRGQFRPEVLVSLQRVSELTGVRVEGRRLIIGAMTTLRALEGLAEYGALAQAVSQLATPVIRYSATVGGNLLQDTRCKNWDRGAHWREALGWCMKDGADVCRVAPGSDRCRAATCSDLAPALVVHEATATILSGDGGVRTAALVDLYGDDGADHLRLGPDELLLDVRVPREDGVRSTYVKLRLRDGIDFPEIGFAVGVRDTDDQEVELRAAVCGAGASIPYLRSEPDRDADAFIRKVYRAVKPLHTARLAPLHRKRAVRACLKSALDGLI